MNYLKSLLLTGALLAAVLALGSPPEARLTQQLGGRATALAALGTNALVAQGRFLHVLDLVSPAYPKLLATLEFRSAVRHLVVRDPLVFVLLEMDGALVDLSEPSAPQVLSYPYGTFANGAIAEDFLVGIGDQSLYVFELIPRTASKRPELLAYVYDKDLQGAKLAALRGTDLIIVDAKGLHLYDLSVPKRPRLKARGELARPPRGLGRMAPLSGAIVGDFLFFYDFPEVVAYNIADPACPKLLAQERFVRVADFRVDQDGSLLLVTQDQEVRWFDPQRPFTVLRQGRVPVPVGTAVTAISWGEWLCVLTAEHGLRMVPKGAVQPHLPPGPAPAFPSATAVAAPRHMGVAEPNPAYDVELAFGHLFVAGGERGLLWFDFSGHALKKLGEIPIPEGAAYGMALKEPWLFLAAGQAGLWVVDARAPAVRAKLALPGSARAVILSGDLAFVAASHAGVCVVDIADPLRPRLRAQISLPGYAWDADVQGQKLFVAAGHEGLLIVDVSRPDQPVLLGSLGLPGVAYSVSVWGEYAFVALGFGGLGVVEVGRPSAPQLAAQLALPGLAFRLRPMEGLLWVAAEWGGVRIFNVDDPLHPKEVGYERIPGGGWVKAAKLGKEHLFLVGTGVHVFRLAAPPQKTTPYVPMENAVFLPPGEVREVALVGDWLYTIDGAGIAVFGLEDPAHPALRAFFPHPVWPGALTLKRAFIHGQHLFILGLGGLFVWSVQDPARPAFVALFPFQGPEAGIDMALAGSHLYIAVSQAILVVNVSTPERPFLVRRVPLQRQAKSLLVAKGHLFVAFMEPWEIGIYLILEAGELQPVGLHRTASYLTSLGVQVGHYLLLGLQGITVWDISEPARPKEVGHFHLTFSPGRMVVHDGVLFVMMVPGVGMFDLSHLPEIRPPWTVASAPGSASAAVVRGEYLYAGFGEGGLAAFRLLRR